MKIKDKIILKMWMVVFSLIFGGYSELVFSGSELKELRPHRAATHFRAVSFAPQTMIAWAVGFDGQILKTENAGKTWSNQESPTFHRLYDVQALDTDNVSACGSGGVVLRSDNGGTVWHEVQTSTRKRLVGIYFINPVIGWVVGDEGIILKTTDSGRSWIHQESCITNGLRSIWFRDDQFGFCVGYQGVVLRTKNGGSTWEKLTVPEGFNIYGADFYHSRDRIFLAGSFGTVIFSDNNGDSWQFMQNVTTNFLRDIAFCDDAHGVAVGYGWILTYDAASENWVRAKSTPGYYLHGVAFTSDGHGIAVGQWGIIFVTADYGKTWDVILDQFSPDLTSVFWCQDGRMVAVGADGHCFYSDGSATSWNQTWTGAKATLNSVCSTPAGTFWAAGDSGALLQSRNGGQTWDMVTLPQSRNLNVVYFIDENHGFVAGEQGLFYQTTNGGLSWQNISMDPFSTINAISFIGQKGWLIGNNGLIKESHDAGKTWFGEYTGITADLTRNWFGSDGQSFIIGNNGLVLHSYSWGQNSSWFKEAIPFQVISIAPGGSYFSIHPISPIRDYIPGPGVSSAKPTSRLSAKDSETGNLWNRETGEVLYGPPHQILSFTSDSRHSFIIGVGEFGRIIRLTPSKP